MYKTTKYITVSALLTTMLFTGCGTTNEKVYGNNTSAPESAEISIHDTYLDLISPKAYNDTTGLNLDAGSTISVIALEKSSEYWLDVKAGAEKAIDDINLDLGYTGKDSIILSYNTPSISGDVEEIINILDSELSRYPAAIAIAISDPYAYGMQFDQAMDNGIPIVAFEGISHSTTLSATVATDYVTMAEGASTKMLELMTDKSDANILVIAPELTTDVSSTKVATINKIIKDSPGGVSLLDVFDLTDLTSIKMDMLADRTWVYNNLSGDNTTIASNPNHESYGELLESVKNIDVLTYVLNETKGITNFITLDDDCNELLINTLNRLDANYEDINIATFGNSEKQLSYLDEGVLDGLMVTNPYGMGYATVVATIRASLDIGNEGLINPGTMWMNK